MMMMMIVDADDVMESAELLRLSGQLSHIAPMFFG